MILVKINIFGVFFILKILYLASNISEEIQIESTTIVEVKESLIV